MNREKLSDHIIHLEKSLLEVEVRNSKDELERLLAPEFIEFGSSGRLFTLNSIIESLTVFEEQVPYEFEEVETRQLSNECVLLLYKVIRNGRMSNRSSVWQLKDGNWQMTFHQGTIVPEE